MNKTRQLLSGCGIIVATKPSIKPQHTNGVVVSGKESRRPLLLDEKAERSGQRKAEIRLQPQHGGTHYWELFTDAAKAIGTQAKS